MCFWEFASPFPSWHLASEYSRAVCLPQISELLEWLLDVATMRVRRHAVCDRDAHLGVNEPAQRHR